MAQVQEDDFNPAYNMYELNQLRTINRRVLQRYPGIDFELSLQEFRDAREAADMFLERQRGPDDTSHLKLHAGASVKLFPPAAHGKFSVEVHSSGVGTITPMSLEFQADYKKSKDPVFLEITTSKRQDLRNERLSIPYERKGRLTIAGQYESITLKEQPDKQVVSSQQQEDIQKNRRVAVCY